MATMQNNKNNNSVVNDYFDTSIHNESFANQSRGSKSK